MTRTEARMEPGNDLVRPTFYQIGPKFEKSKSRIEESLQHKNWGLSNLCDTAVEVYPKNHR